MILMGTFKMDDEMFKKDGKDFLKALQISFAQSSLNEVAKDMEKDFLNDGIVCEITIKVKDVDIEKAKNAAQNNGFTVLDDGTIISVKDDKVGEDETSVAEDIKTALKQAIEYEKENKNNNGIKD